MLYRSNSRRQTRMRMTSRCGDLPKVHTVLHHKYNLFIFISNNSFVQLTDAQKWQLLQLQSSPLSRWRSSSSPVPRSKCPSVGPQAILSPSLPSPRWASEHGILTNPMPRKQSPLHSKLDTDIWTAQQSTAMKKRWAMALKLDWRRSGWIDPVSGLHQSCGTISTFSMPATWLPSIHHY